MGKRSEFERNPRDYYPTPAHAVEPLARELQTCTFYEPCAGDGRLIDHLESYGHSCVGAMDIEPLRDDIEHGDALMLTQTSGADYIITNPPWDRKLLHPLIERFSLIAPTWLLFDADWVHTKQAIPYMTYCHKIVSIGRVKWFNDKAGLDNSCWYLFDKDPADTIFVSRKD